MLISELQFLFLRLREYPKCYWIWLYRKWCLEVCPEADWDTELALVTKLLEADARNCRPPPRLPFLAFIVLHCHRSFSTILLSNVCMLITVHGWEYRRYVVASIEKAKGISLAKKEFDYTTVKTNNISNYFPLQRQKHSTKNDKVSCNHVSLLPVCSLDLLLLLPLLPSSVKYSYHR